MNKLLENITIFILLPIILFFIFLKPILPKSNFEKVLKPLKTARIDIKNLGRVDNEVLIKKIKNKKLIFWQPKWFKNERGQGTQIEVYGNHAIFKVTCINEGKLLIQLLGMDCKNKNEKRYPVWINYTKCLVNGKNILNEVPTVVWHDKRFKYEFNVKNNEEVILELEWEIHNFTNSEIEEHIDSIFKASFITKKEKNKFIKKILKIKEINKPKSQKPKQQD